MGAGGLSVGLMTPLVGASETGHYNLSLCVRQLKALAKSRLSGVQTSKKLRRTTGAVAQKAMMLGVRC
jgi:bisphosphoglycerate-independent phosphoglycerate mutase (AlkP superfamily)